MSSLLDRWDEARDWVVYGFPGGPRFIKAAWSINLQKGGTLPFVLGLMAWYDNWTVTAWVYAALHGSYGLLWLLKDRAFPDANWERYVTLGGALNLWLGGLALYWIAPVLIVSRGITASPTLIGVAIFAYVLGAVLMMGSDAQKYFVLKVRRGLVTDGFFARVRHPNYLGEMLLYGSFALLAQHWAPWAVLAWIWLGTFLPNMLAKERSMRRYPEWEAYCRRAGFLLPRLFPRRDPVARPAPGV